MSGRMQADARMSPTPATCARRANEVNRLIFPPWGVLSDRLDGADYPPGRGHLKWAIRPKPWLDLASNANSASMPSRESSCSAVSEASARGPSARALDQRHARVLLDAIKHNSMPVGGDIEVANDVFGSVAVSCRSAPAPRRRVARRLRRASLTG